MAAQDLVSAELRRAELEIDQAHRSNGLVHLSFAEAAWYFLAFCEERFVTAIVAPGAAHPFQHAAFADAMIVHAEHPLRWLLSSCAPGGQAPNAIDDAKYSAA